ncbi:hypothetical protein SAMN05421690_1001127 [Nitrosomonas sp. Nm51]|nr:hypothetical protein SAMN05421690_1001127 [Nitrosomonas sp. Nm51]
MIKSFKRKRQAEKRLRILDAANTLERWLIIQ